jgi:molybdate transport system ATP-binding protein
MSAGGLLEARIELTRSDRFQLRVELSVPSGTTIALLGPNGAGKSSVVAAIAGLLPIDSGRISIGDTLLDEPGKGRFVPPEDRRVGVVFQDFLLFPHLSVVDNVAFGPRSRGISRDESRSMALRAIDDMGLGGLADQRPGELSGGQAQRVALARALAAEPDVLLLDEPFSSLDVTTRWQLRQLLGERLVTFAGPRVVVTHDPAEAFLLADEVYVIESGRITQSGTPDDIRIRPRTSFAAGLAGVNLFSGRAVEGGAVDISGHLLNVVDGESAGEVLVTIHPQAISVHTEAPRGSPRNVWETTVEVLEVLGDRARLRCAAPLPITAELTLSSVSELGLRAGSRVWLAVKATEISVETVSGGSQEA